MTLIEKQRELIAQLSRLRGAQERLVWLVERARQRPRLAEALKTDAFRIEGCLSRLWFAPEFRAGRCYFQSDSDSQIVRAIAGLLCEFYSGQPPEEIAAHDPGFLGQLGITQHLTPNRRNGLSRLRERIRVFALEQCAP